MAMPRPYAALAANNQGLHERVLTEQEKRRRKGPGVLMLDDVRFSDDLLIKESPNADKLLRLNFGTQL